MRRIARLLLLLVVLPAAVLFASEKEITVAVSRTITNRNLP